MSEGGDVRLSKHHGAGNDFLVFLDLGDRRRFSAAEVVALCDRHRGVGADGLLRVLDGGADATLAMELQNADGSEAAMSGNGIRCLVQAAVEAGVVAEGTVAVRTPAGVRTVEYEALGPGLGRATVDMGPVTLGPSLEVPEPAGVERARRVDVGNPHVVLLCSEVDDEAVRIAGARLERSVPGGTNVELVWRRAGPDSLWARVFERGVGETLACGTGACAAAAAAHGWGIVGARVEVHLTGGVLEVELGASSVALRGPTRKVADVTVREADLAQLVAELEEPGEPELSAVSAGGTERRP
ncbi:MAG TPA: diaminopimelate epimerase [Acidimicrobiales bacterium]|nr:diaminopimelate epimerase [Acidimicrobiales bacterium]